MSVSVSLPLNRDTSKYRSVSAEAGDETTGRRGIFSRYNNLHAYLYDIMDSYSNIDLNPYMCVHFIFFYILSFIYVQKKTMSGSISCLYIDIFIFLFLSTTPFYAYFPIDIHLCGIAFIFISIFIFKSMSISLLLPVRR